MATSGQDTHLEVQVSGNSTDYSWSGHAPGGTGLRLQYWLLLVRAHAWRYMSQVTVLPTSGQGTHLEVQVSGKSTDCYIYCSGHTHGGSCTCLPIRYGYARTKGPNALISPGGPRGAVEGSWGAGVRDTPVSYLWLTCSPDLWARATCGRGANPRLTCTHGGHTETLYYGDDALTTNPVMHYQGTTYLCY